jgi:DNA-binding NarL/FixJ family response regulator
MAVRCLLIDDNPEFLASAAQLLASQGIDVVACASTGVEAIRVASDQHPDVALVDVQLGDEDGVEVADRLRELLPDTAIILISTHEYDDVADLVAESAAIGFVAKTALSAQAIRELVG